MEKYLNTFIVGEQGKVKKIEAEGKIKRRLFDMGVTPGTEIVLNPIEVTIRGYELTLRKDEANKVLMEVTK